MPVSLYVRVMNNFYTHRKTIRLRAAIGDAAFWVPPRLWAYAAENQPDGIFKDYSATEIALLIGYLGDAKALLEALLEARYMDNDPLRVHDWEEHNGYHSTFAKRAKTAAKARWDKDSENTAPSVPDKKGQERKGKEASIAVSNASSIKLESEGNSKSQTVTPESRQNSQAEAEAEAEEKKKTDALFQKLEIPEHLKTPEFIAEWERWQTYRRGFKKSANWLRLFAGHLELLSKHSEYVARTSLYLSRCNSWQGLFPDKVPPQAGRTAPLPNGRHRGVQY